MNIISIGAGNLATNLCIALARAGHNIEQVYSRTSASAENLACKVAAQAITDISQLDIDADLCIVSVSDNILPTVAHQLVHHLEESDRQCQLPLIVHTAGSMPMDVIPTTRRGVVYPMQTFSKQRLVDFSMIPVFIEANQPEDLELLRQLASTLSGNVQQLSSADRRYLHLAAVFCSNFTNHCYTLADKILSQHNVPFSAMLPLIDEVAAKVHTMSPHDAQTGPARRNDTTVMQAQANLLSGQPLMQQIYKTMSESIAND